MTDEMDRSEFERRLLESLGISRDDWEAYKASREHQEWEKENAEALRIREVFVAEMRRRAEELSERLTSALREGMLPADARVVFDSDPLVMERPVCSTCLDTGTVCENHPDHAWAPLVGGDFEECCGGAGMPCPKCCSPIPQDGTHSIVEGFTPDWMR